MFEISDLTLPTPITKMDHTWLCTNCQKISLSRGSCTCGCKEFLPHLDRRPLVLTTDTRSGILDLIDAAADRVPQAEIDEQLHLTGEYMPFLSKLLDEAELAETRRREGLGGYRTSSLSTAEMLELFKSMKLPPTS